MPSPRRFTRRWLLVLLPALLGTGCASYVRSTPPPVAPSQAGSLQIVDTLPTQLPKGGHRFPGQQFVLLPQDSAVALLVPVPFVGEAIESTVDDSRAKRLAAGYHALDPFQIAVGAAAGKPMFNDPAASARLYPYVFVSEGHDARYRLSLVFQVEDGKWMGRYFYHLPTSVPKASVATPDRALVAALQQDMTQGAATLVRLIEQDYHGKLQPTGRVAKIGSLYIVGGKIAGLVSPDSLAYPGAEVLEETPTDIVLRHDGLPAGPGQSGALLFGVHHFKRDQLNVFQAQ